jgi:hypothetical protein
MGPPPSRLVTGYQRCNSPGNSVFYLSASPETAIFEVRPSVGDNVFLAIFRPICDLVANFNFEKLSDCIDETDSAIEIAVKTFFDTLFTRRVHSTFSNDYVITAALSEIFLEKTAKGITGCGEKVDSMGLAYPSVVNISGEINFAFRSSMIENFRIFGVSHFVVRSVLDDCVVANLVKATNLFDYEADQILW